MLQQKVYIKKDVHRYFDLDGNEFTSVSRVLDSIDEKFDPGIAKHCAGKGKYIGMSEKEVLASWEKKRDRAANHGTRIHDAIENYTKYFTIEPGNEDLESMLKGIASDYVPYKITHSEAILYSPYFEKLGTRIAGTTDRVLILPTKAGYFDMEDYKTNLERGIEFYNESNKYLLDPVSYLPKCNYSKYSLQLSIYASMVEELTGMKCRSLWLRFIPADNPLAYQRIPVNYMKTAAHDVMLKFHSNRITTQMLAASAHEQVPNF